MASASIAASPVRTYPQFSAPARLPARRPRRYCRAHCRARRYGGRDRLGERVQVAGPLEAQPERVPRFDRYFSRPRLSRRPAPSAELDGLSEISGVTGGLVTARAAIRRAAPVRGEFRFAEELRELGRGPVGLDQLAAPPRPPGIRTDRERPPARRTGSPGPARPAGRSMARGPPAPLPQQPWIPAELVQRAQAGRQRAQVPARSSISGPVRPGRRGAATASPGRRVAGRGRELVQGVAEVVVIHGNPGAPAPAPPTAAAEH